VWVIGGVKLGESSKYQRDAALGGAVLVNSMLSGEGTCHAQLLAKRNRQLKTSC